MLSFNVKEDEKRLHKLFSEYKHRNEWFVLPKSFVENRANWFTSSFSPKPICLSIYRQSVAKGSEYLDKNFTTAPEFPFDRLAIKTLISIDDYAIAQMSGLHIGKIHNDRYNGLYRKTAAQLRKDAGLKDSETPLDVMSSRDLQMNGLANTLALEAEDANLLFDFANDIKESYERRMKKPLTPIFEEKLLRPSQARAIAFAPEYQNELPLGV